MLGHSVIAAAALGAAWLTFFSGFGLGTVLLPVFALFMPVEVAVAATAVVHLANNLLKLVLVGRHADRGVVVRFGVPAVAAAAVGAGLLLLLGEAEPLARYRLAGREAVVTPVGLGVGTLIVAFALLDLHPRFKGLEFGRRWLPAGGLLSGFFGGLSGHQGALRSAFLVRAGLETRPYVGTATVCSVLVDAVRLVVYLAGGAILAGGWHGLPEADGSLIATGCVAAFAGSLLGSRMLGKVTISSLHTLVGLLLLATGVAMGAGWV